MKCKEVRQLLAPFLDGELPGEEQELVKAHLEECRPCREFFAEAGRVSHVLRTMGSEVRQAPAGFKDEVMRRIREDAAAADRDRIRRIPGWSTLVSSAAVVVLVVLVAWGSQMPVFNVADHTPSLTNSYQGTPAESGGQPDVKNPAVNSNTDPANQQDAQSPPNSEGIIQPGGDTIPSGQEEPGNDAAVDITELQWSSYEDPVVASTLMKIKVPEYAASLDRILSLASEYDAATENIGRQDSEQASYYVIKATVDKSRVDAFTAKLAALGTVVNKEQTTQNISATYNEAVQQYQTLSVRRTEAESEQEKAKIDQQIADVKKQLSTYQQQAKQETIVIWLML